MAQRVVVCGFELDEGAMEFEMWFDKFNCNFLQIIEQTVRTMFDERKKKI